MPQKAWTFDLDGQQHHVAVEYSYVSANEKFWVDDNLISSEARWTFKSQYDFSIGQHQCQVILSVEKFAPSTKLTIDGEPVEMLPSQSLLRASQKNEPTTLLRPHNKPTSTASHELLRSSDDKRE